MVPMNLTKYLHFTFSINFTIEIFKRDFLPDKISLINCVLKSLYGGPKIWFKINYNIQ